MAKTLPRTQHWTVCQSARKLANPVVARTINPERLRENRDQIERSEVSKWINKRTSVRHKRIDHVHRLDQ